MQTQTPKADIGKFTNFYCDGIASALDEFITLPEDVDIAKYLSDEDCQTLVDYAVMKNKVAGVGQLYIKVPDFNMGKNALEKFGMAGYEIISAKNCQNMSTSAMIGGNTIIELESLLDFQQGELSEIADLTARAELPTLFHLGQDLEEVGKIVNLYKHSPAEVLESFGFLDRQCFLLGLNFIDKDDQKLLHDYGATCIFTPRDDGEHGRGAINLYNFIYNQLKFGFGSGKCYNIDMLAEGKLALYNTANLMYDANLISPKELLAAIACNSDPKEVLDFLGVQNGEKERNLLDKKVNLWQYFQNDLHLQAQEISYKLKEKI